MPALQPSSSQYFQYRVHTTKWLLPVKKLSFASHWYTVYKIRNETPFFFVYSSVTAGTNTIQMKVTYETGRELEK